VVREIPLTQGKIALVDDEDYDRVMPFKWCAVLNNRWWYAKRAVIVDNVYINLYLHRFILSADSSVLIDHKNGDGLDCQKQNMREATKGQNCCNAKKSKNNTSGFKGVSRERTKWLSQIKHDGVVFRLGLFDSQENAAKVYDAAAVFLFGDFAWTNFTEVDPALIENLLNNNKLRAIPAEAA
jgi:hypothetical protein